MEKSNKSDYINEVIIIENGNPISFQSLRNLDKISENNICKIYGRMHNKINRNIKI